MSQDNPEAAVTATPDTKPTPWAGFGYAPVRGLVDRRVARFLRTQRKNMRRFFQERGHLDLFAQMDDLRKNSGRDFRSKNTTFQRILNEHIARSVPNAAIVPEAAHAEVAEADATVPPGPVDVCSEGSSVAVPPAHGGTEPVRSVPQLASTDGSVVVIEE